jgi:hypothetical protein
MRKIVLVFGLIAGAILSVIMLLTIPFKDQIGYDHGAVIGYTSMVLAFLLVYFGVRSYRDNIAGGTIGFGRALGVGALIALIASACYVATWEVLYHTVASDYLTSYEAHALEKARASGESPAAIAAKKAELDKYAELYKNPAFNIAFTCLEPLPVALIFVLVSAGVLSRRRRVVGGGGAEPAIS